MEMGCVLAVFSGVKGGRPDRLAGVCGEMLLLRLLPNTGGFVGRRDNMDSGGESTRTNFDSRRKRRKAFPGSRKGNRSFDSFTFFCFFLGVLLLLSLVLSPSQTYIHATAPSLPSSWTDS